MSTYPTPDEYFRRLHAAGWSVGETGTASGWLVSGRKLEQGTRASSLELAWRIAQALGCSLDDAFVRGCCVTCYGRHKKAVAAGLASWADLERRGLVRPTQPRGQAWRVRFRGGRK
jgi:hypothetical protein